MAPYCKALMNSIMSTLIISVAAVMVIGTTTAQTSEIKRIASGAVKEGRSSSTAARDVALTNAIQTGMQQASIPGLIAGVWQKGKRPYVRAFGVRNTETREPMHRNLYMRIGSVTKTFAVTAVLQLVDQGKVGLDDPIDQYVPDVPNGEKITIRQLAAMRSGLYDYTPEIVPNRVAQEPERQWTPQELLAISFRRPPVFAPGTEFDYANINTVLRGSRGRSL